MHELEVGSGFGVDELQEVALRFGGAGDRRGGVVRRLRVGVAGPGELVDNAGPLPDVRGTPGEVPGFASALLAVDVFGGHSPFSLRSRARASEKSSPLYRCRQTPSLIAQRLIASDEQSFARAPSCAQFSGRSQSPTS